jgi:hypothetical protein
MESKHGEGKFLDEKLSAKGERSSRDGYIDPLVEEFVEFTTSNDYIATVKQFYENNCAGFEEYESFIESGAGMKLEWMDTHRRYMELVDEQLNEYCRQNGYSAIDVFNRIQDTISNDNYSDFVPLFLKSIEEGFFFEQMSTYALQNDIERDAKRVNRQHNSESISGVWYLDPDRVDDGELRDWVEKAGKIKVEINFQFRFQYLFYI